MTLRRELKSEVEASLAARAQALRVHMRKVTSRKSAHAPFLRSYKHPSTRNLRVIDRQFESAAKPDVLENVEALIFPGRDDNV